MAHLRWSRTQTLIWTRRPQRTTAPSMSRSPVIWKDLLTSRWERNKTLFDVCLHNCTLHQNTCFPMSGFHTTVTCNQKHGVGNSCMLFMSSGVHPETSSRYRWSGNSQPFQETTKKQSRCGSKHNDFTLKFFACKIIKCMSSLIFHFLHIQNFYHLSSLHPAVIFSLLFFKHFCVFFQVLRRGIWSSRQLRTFCCVRRSLLSCPGKPSRLNPRSLTLLWRIRSSHSPSQVRTLMTTSALKTSAQLM